MWCRRLKSDGLCFERPIGLIVKLVGGHGQNFTCHYRSVVVHRTGRAKRQVAVGSEFANVVVVCGEADIHIGSAEDFAIAG